MRLLHPKTIEILESHPEFPKTHLAHYCPVISLKEIKRQVDKTLKV